MAARHAPKNEHPFCRANCGTTNNPAFLCSGILFRGTQASTAYHSWNPSPGSQQRGGVSFSFLRADSKFSRLAYGYTNGLIFKPYQLVGAGKLNPTVLCAFPVDAWTDGRTSKGCGAHTLFPLVSGPCQSQGITTAPQWVSHFSQPSNNENAHSCGFDVSSGGTGHAAHFMAELAARTLIAAESFGQNDELVIAAWSQMENPTPLPIQAFFYLPGGLAGAQYDQKDYYKHAGAVIPIIAMRLPASAANDASFVYQEQDQAVGETEPPPVPGSDEDFETVPVGPIFAGTNLTTRFLVINPGRRAGGITAGSSWGHVLELSIGGAGADENIPRVTFIREASAVTFKGSLAGTIDFYAADGALLGSFEVTAAGTQTVTFRSPDGRKIKYMEPSIAHQGNFGDIFDDFAFTD